MLGYSCFLLAFVAASTSAQNIPEVPAIATATSTATYYPAYIPPASVIFKRDDSCPANTFRCSEELGERFRDICCQNGQTCAVDADDEPACCPSGAICTGTAPASATGAATASPSFVPNSYFAFPYAAATFENEASCTSAVSACGENYDQCVNYLGDGGQYGVTIVVPGGGGTTVEGGGQALGSSSATAVCSSLSSRACGNVSSADCSDYGNHASSSNSRGLWVASLGAGITLLSFLV
ncbi:hypothetical protein NXS19_001702 [Fusarium pseudograminearum]|uniref:Gpi-anchored protein n=1 Tax=Fusarium pseudograminearum (strain CS3096) TaxID=1028729 RepID=K3V595_FUSPC|nr:hypothetical protein FPSE_11541 [Fusarium pseudograminearum CS3096]EKJ68297.1 hypothetical protein FPSE_11541 [Fusarium pseudograminearum CS3096]KAF0638733.1 hypothetical protein FPSE5266_11541 [Fusarium pseudograminearum]UZP33886.1 hypothetical protein NXS19_001702 [Fusarium pseudograminearum]